VTLLKEKLYLIVYEKSGYRKEITPLHIIKKIGGLRDGERIIYVTANPNIRRKDYQDRIKEILGGENIVVRFIVVNNFREHLYLVNMLWRYLNQLRNANTSIVIDSMIYVFITSFEEEVSFMDREIELTEQIAMLKNTAVKYGVSIYIVSFLHDSEPILWKLFKRYVDEIIEVRYIEEEIVLIRKNNLLEEIERIAYREEIEEN